MKYKIIFAIMAIVVVAIVFNTSQYALGMSAGAPTGCAGSPSDQQTCKNAGCHSGNPIALGSGWITSNIPAGGYTPGQTYTITATATYAGFSKFGFEITAENASGNFLGTLVNTSSETQILYGNTYISHTSTGNSNPNSKTWSFDWIAPPSGSGPLSFYGCFACCNGDATNLGDFIYHSSLSVAEAPTPGTDAGILPIDFPSVFACDSIFIPIVTLRNFGTNTINSCTVNYFVDANTPSNYSWSGILSPGNSVQVTLPQLIVSAQGTHTFTATSSNPNGGADAFTVNDSRSVVFQSVYTSRSMQFTEGFESSTFPPPGWVIQNPDHGVTWDRYTFIHYTGSACLYINNFGYDSKGQKDALITPEINLTTSPSPSLTFEHAYQMYSDSGSSVHSSDTLSIFISTDCGTTWTMLYNKYDTLLTTVIPSSNNLQFWPSSNDWVLDFIDLSPYTFCDNAILKFQNTTDYGNELFIDDVNVGSPAGIKNENSGISSLAIFPVPATDYLNVNFESNENSSPILDIYNMRGELEKQISLGAKSDGKFSEAIDLRNFSSGIYLMSVTVGEKVVTRKFSVQH